MKRMPNSSSSDIIMLNTERIDITAVEQVGIAPDVIGGDATFSAMGGRGASGHGFMQFQLRDQRFTIGCSARAPAAPRAGQPGSVNSRPLVARSMPNTWGLRCGHSAAIRIRASARSVYRLAKALDEAFRGMAHLHGLAVSFMMFVWPPWSRSACCRRR